MDPMRLVDPRHLPQLMSLEDHEPTVLGGTLEPRNSTPAGGQAGAPGQQQRSFPWEATVLAGVLITTIVVDVIGNLLVVVSVFRNRKLRKAGRSLTASARKDPQFSDRLIDKSAIKVLIRPILNKVLDNLFSIT